MPMPDAERDVTAAELALGVLEGEGRAAALRRVLAEPPFARDVEEWRAHLAPLLLEWPEAEPPAALGARIERALDAPSAGAGNGDGNVRFWKTLSGIAMLAAACMAFALVTRVPVPAPLAPPAPQETGMPMVATLGGTGNTAARAAAIYDKSNGEFRIAPASFAPADRSAQLWMIGRDGIPHSLGLLAPTGETRMRLPMETRSHLGRGMTLAVSVEPLGGSPTAQPTGPVVATGSLI